ncbi:class I SAM-dependent methyltransferase [Nocardia speluncae]|uniref:Class I SAM-dependent methyltransferase n=1 Tax=Nocardia speluncae TaxID=419477 RepID=A0A846XEK8_9NOCA|nr:class I SAM-dependent methyltransferase [Nocardia speluncae]NKY33156.1 class I SAM-dependent methyltransferase [Nocardia speluncae]
MDTDTLIDATQHAGETAAGPLDGARFHSARADLDTFGLQAMADALASIFTEGSVRTAAEAADRLEVASRHRWLLRRWLRTLTEHAWLTGDPDGGYHTLHRGPAPTRADLRSVCADLGYPPALATFFAQANARSLPLLRDRVLVQELLFPDGDFLTAEVAYRDNTVNRYLNAAAAHLVAETVRHRASEGTVRILELGAGIGGTTADIVGQLDGYDVDYRFTDLSTFFLTAARERFAAHPWLRYDLLDLNTDLPGQEPSDIIVAANVLHNAHHAGETLRRIHDALTPGGLLVFLESCQEHSQLLTSMHFLMSARFGLPHPGRADVRAGSDRIFLDGAEWLGEMTTAGLRPLPAIPRPDHPLAALGQFLFAAFRPQ